VGIAPAQTRTRGAQAIHRALDLLRAVARHDQEGVGLSRAAEEVGLHVATAHRILSVLVKEGFITHDPVSKLYQLGLELHTLGQAAHRFLIRDRYRGVLERIALETEDTVFLLIRSGLDVLCIDRVEGKYPIRTLIVNVGARRPLGIGAGSLALLAFLPEEERDRIIAANAHRYPQYKGIRERDVREMVGRFGPRGFTVSEGLFHEGVTSVGIPLFEDEGSVAAAVTVSAICPRMSEVRREAIVTRVREIARRQGPWAVRRRGRPPGRNGKGA
jgi:DNA-binding IclR family transcriptional regulator